MAFSCVHHDLDPYGLILDTRHTYTKSGVYLPSTLNCLTGRSADSHVSLIDRLVHLDRGHSHLKRRTGPDH